MGSFLLLNQYYANLENGSALVIADATTAQLKNTTALYTTVRFIWGAGDIFDKTKSTNGRKVVVILYNLFGATHSPTALVKWLKDSNLQKTKKGKPDKLKDEDIPKVINPAWPANMTGKFRAVACDEAQLMQSLGFDEESRKAQPNHRTGW
ncbi:hypothetical protein EJ04DRAFT_528808 [Polyplosphaeria fusca]|uniref:Uncharacterized protein n=1 Tax=Polyplosphaeria fusca TaxID=682080 RepID=A0A9P4QJ17_9PLEO|nr:hypothetical protein EJ04DRAFT_528808 [Polyplosphaeria fusca]